MFCVYKVFTFDSGFSEVQRFAGSRTRESSLLPETLESWGQILWICSCSGSAFLCQKELSCEPLRSEHLVSGEGFIHWKEMQHHYRFLANEGLMLLNKAEF